MPGGLVYQRIPAFFIQYNILLIGVFDLTRSYRLRFIVNTRKMVPFSHVAGMLTGGMLTDLNFESENPTVSARTKQKLQI